VILGAAKLDTLLYQLLGKVLIPSATGKDDLLDGDSPLSTFSSRIHVAYRLGLIDAAFAKALHLIRRIRNAFAHELSGCTLDSGPHRDRVKELFLPFKGLSFIEKFGKHFFTGKHQGPSCDFRIVLSVMMGRLEYALLLALPIKQKKSLSLTREDWKNEMEHGEEGVPAETKEKGPKKLDSPK